MWTHRPKKGLYPLMIAVTIKRKITYFKTAFRLRKNQWNGSIINYANASLANAAVRKQISDIEKLILERSLTEEVTVKSLRFKSTVSFSEFAKDVKGDTRPNRKEIKRLLTFNGGDPSIADIDTIFLRRFEKYERQRGMSQNTINTTFKWLRRIINQAIAEKKIKSNPFDGFIVPRYVQTDRTYLIEEERLRLLKLLDESFPYYNTLCYFLLSCYSGLRHQDWSRFNADKVEEGFLKLRAKKNKELVVLPIGPTLQNIIDRVLKLPPPFTKEECNRELKLIAVSAKIKKNLTNHVGRHSFAHMCATKKLPKSVTAELMGISSRTVEVYYHISGQNIIDQAAALKFI